MAHAIYRTHHYLRWSALTGWIWIVALGAMAQAQVRDIDWAMYRDPGLPVPQIQVSFPDGLVDVWVRALGQPQRDLKRRAAAAVIQGHIRGVPGLEASVPLLEKIVAQPDEEKTIRLTAAQALVTLNSRQSAQVLFESLREGNLDLAEVVEPALARWAFAPAKKLWRQRLGQEIGLRRAHILAIEGLTVMGDREALPRFRELAEDRRVPSSIRLAAAAGLGQLQESELEQAALSLMQDKSLAAMVDRLVAARMLAGHRSNDVLPVLKELAGDPSPAVQAPALRQLLKIDPQNVIALADPLISSSDAQVRRCVAEALVAVAARPETEHIVPLATMLADPNPSLRAYVRESLTQLAENDALHDTVIDRSRSVLDQEAWRGIEQAIQLLVVLDDKSIVDRLLVLLDNQRPEVHTTAAWGLCQLNAPSTADAISEIFASKTEQALANNQRAPKTHLQLAHLAQALGRLMHQPADATLRKYISKETSLEPVARASAIWALGLLHHEQPDEQLVRLLAQRMTDLDSLSPEDSIVRRMATVSLGRMKADQTLSSMRRLLTHEGTHVATGVACGWAIQQITGEPLPKIPAIPYFDNDWFLVPDIALEAASSDEQ